MKRLQITKACGKNGKPVTFILENVTLYRQYRNSLDVIYTNDMIAERHKNVIDVKEV